MFFTIQAQTNHNTMPDVIYPAIKMYLSFGLAGIEAMLLVV